MGLIVGRNPELCAAPVVQNALAMKGFDAGDEEVTVGLARVLRIGVRHEGITSFTEPEEALRPGKDRAHTRAVMAPVVPSSRPPQASSPTQPSSTAAPRPAPAPAPNAGWTPSSHRTRQGKDAAQLKAADLAARLLRGVARSNETGRGSKVFADLPDANSAANTNPKTQRFQGAARQVEALKAQESRVWGTLPPPLQQAYTQVCNEVGSNPVARLSLQQLLFEGALQSTDSHGGTLLATMASLSNPRTPLAPGLNRAQLVGELAQELAQPSLIDQAQRNTCGPTTVSIYLAATRPAEYARLVAGLASPGGTVAMMSGSLRRVAGTTTEDQSGRTSTQRLLEPALLDFADGAALSYDNAADKHTLLGVPTVPGALPSMVASMLTALMGRPAESSGSLLGRPSSQAMRALEQSTRADVPVPTMIDYGASGEHFGLHWVLATRVDKDQVVLVNPWGREEVMPRREFDSRVRGLAIPGAEPGR